MPSARRAAAAARRPSLSETIFLDRNLGKNDLATALRGRGLTVVTMADFYGSEQVAAFTADVDWIADVAAEGYIAFHKDVRITRNPDEREAVLNTNLRMFALTNANITGKDFTAWYLTNLNRILQRARHPGPYVYGVYRDSIKKVPLS